jgi:hypothetical protein
MEIKVVLLAGEQSRELKSSQTQTTARVPTTTTTTTQGESKGGFGV